MKRILCIGKVVNGGAVQIAPLETLLDAQMARNAEVLAMNADLDALLAGKPLGYRLTAAQLEQLDDENPGAEYCTQPWRW